MFPHFQQPEWLLLLLLIPGAVALFIYGETMRKAALRGFSGDRSEAEGRLWERRISFICFSIAVFLLTIALSRPAWKREATVINYEGRDVIFLLDVSRSMLAGDLTPNRLEAAKQAIRECADVLRGDRIALVTFAGTSSIECPLTTDFQFFDQRLQDASPENVDHGGTRIGDALRKVSDKLLSEERAGLQDLILLTDGGDQESRPEDAALELDETGASLVVIGIGDEQRGARVPAWTEDDSLQFTMYEGQEVWSRLETVSLEQLSKAPSRGSFINNGTNHLPLGEIYPDLRKHLSRNATPSSNETHLRWIDTFPTFLTVGFLFLLPIAFRFPARATIALLWLSLISTSLAVDETKQLSPEEEFLSAETMFEARNFLGAAESFLKSAEGLPDETARCLAIYNLANCYLLQARADSILDPLTALNYYDNAIKAYRSCVRLRTDFEAAIWNFEIAMTERGVIQEQVTREADQDQQQPDENQQQNENQEGDDSEFSEEDYEGEWEESEAEGEASSEMNQQTQNSMNFDETDVPPPTISPEDLIRGEQEQKEAREENRDGERQTVEKDW